MHNYLRAIGFSNIKKKKEIDTLLNEVIDNPSFYKMAADKEGNEVVELSREFGDSIGIAIRGEYADDEKFYVDYYYPYFKGNGVTTQELVEVEKRTETDSYAGICDDIKVGVSLIFFLQNVSEYLQYYDITKTNRIQETTTMAALSLDAKILFPIKKSESQKKRLEQNSENRTQMIAAAREGDEEAIESMTLEDIDTYSMLSRRILTEDILSIVDSYFMPYGIESDQYSILGEIIDYKKIVNQQTEEELYRLTVECNGLIFDVCINCKDLLGEPAIGRRFKGVIWMQGHINFSTI